MFKKMFGPKKVEGVGTPVPIDELRGALLECFPKQGEINQYLTIEKCDDSPDGFNAVWKFYALALDQDGTKDSFLFTHTVKVIIQPQENAVNIKSKRSAKASRVPENETLHDSYIWQVQIGKIEALKAVEKKKIRKFSHKKSIEPLIKHITENGWDAHHPKVLI